VLIAVAIIVPVALISDDDDNSRSKEGGSKAAAKDLEQWQLLSPELDPYKITLNAWPNDDSLVVMRDTYVASYARANGEQNWQTPPPSPQGRFCGYGTAIIKNKLALAYSKQGGNPSGVECEFASVLDVKSGELSWEHELGTPQNVAVTPPNSGILEIIGDVIVVAQEEGMVGLDLDSGDERWKTPASALVESSEPCRAYDMMAAKSEAYVSITCQIRGNDKGFKLVGMDPETGKPIKRKDYRQADLGIDPRYAHFISTSPPIVAIQDEGTFNEGGFLVMDDQLNKVTFIEDGPVDSPDEIIRDSQFDATTLEVQHQFGRYLITEELFVSVTRPFVGLVNKLNKLVAYDLKSGEQRWAVTVPETTVATPVAVEADTIIAVGSHVSGKGDTTLIRLNPKDGTVIDTEGFAIRANPEPNRGYRPRAIRFRYFWEDDRIYAVQGGASTRFPQIAMFTLGSL
jgi:outer membrane protein assembly factor BamB